ncbi:MAG TPA: histidine kinase dimerization/phospho-acceptor domain-containing protein [Candidatus Deferrimicrobium sp.]|nr:histidine kinase dimerization/phospho-acceptor domain-containing protein [Candidatus Deferrimicrobium sp.]
MTKLTVENVDSNSASTDELAVFHALKPYYGHCLTLNHDVNNPLAGIIGYSEFLLQEADYLNDTHRGFVAQILKCGERIKELVDKLCEEKIALAENVDLKSVTEAYKKIARPLK